MHIQQTPLSGVHLIEIDSHEDDRGSFARMWDRTFAKENELIERFDYFCISRNTKKGTFRGMHYQKDPHGETKLVRCTQGAIFDVAVDLRPDSPTFRQWYGAELSAENHHALYIPTGCAHGFLSLTDDTEVLYMIAGEYNKEAECGVRWDDPAFGIEWPMEVGVVSERDKGYVDFKSI